MKPRGLINETYAAAADTKMHCKYGVPEKLLSSDEIYACPSYTRVRTSNFFSFVETIRWALFFFVIDARSMIGSAHGPVVIVAFT